MIFIYNETDLPLKLISTMDTTKTSAHLHAVLGDSKPECILSANDDAIMTALHNRYNHGRFLKYNPAREYVLVKDVRLLVNPETNTYVISDGKNDKYERKNYVKNTIMLVLHKDSKYFIKKDILKKSHTINDFGPNGDYKIVTLHITTFNWSSLPGVRNILINGIKPIELELTCSEVKAGQKPGTSYKQNIINVHDYNGTFPEIKPKSSNKKFEHKTKGFDKHNGQKKPYNSTKVYSKPLNKHNKSRHRV